MLDRKVDGIVRIRPDFSRNLSTGEEAEVQVLAHGGDANRARIIAALCRKGPLGQWSAQRAPTGAGRIRRSGDCSNSRLWFNEADDSHYYLVPGLIVVVMTIIGAFLTTMVMAREWERGTLEALFVTPVRTDEILLGKTVAVFRLGHDRSGAVFACRANSSSMFRSAARCWCCAWRVDAVSPGRAGHRVADLLGRSRVNSWPANLPMVVTYLPAMMLSGFLFDLRSMPVAVQVITYVFPARYFVSLLQTVFLAGDVWAVILPERRRAGCHGRGVAVSAA